MSSVDDLARQLRDVERDLAILKQESTINVGLLATAVRRARLGLAAVAQNESVRRIAGPTNLIDWTPRAGAFAERNTGQGLAERLRGAASQGAGEPAAVTTTLLLRDILAAFDAVILTAVQPAELRLGAGSAGGDVRIVRPGAKTIQVDDTAGGPAKLWLAGDLVEILDASFAVTYNGDGTVALVVRSGAAGAASTTIVYAGTHVASVATVRGGKTVTVTPTYTGDQITSLARVVA